MLSSVDRVRSTCKKVDGEGIVACGAGVWIWVNHLDHIGTGFCFWGTIDTIVSSPVLANGLSQSC